MGAIRGLIVAILLELGLGFLITIIYFIVKTIILII
jgi:hypothetical protein